MSNTILGAAKKFGSLTKTSGGRFAECSPTPNIDTPNWFWPLKAVTDGVSWKIMNAKPTALSLPYVRPYIKSLS